MSSHTILSIARVNYPLQVPLDYQNVSAGNAAIAIIKLPANLTSKEVQHGGPILLNPGGPGGSGVLFIQSFGKFLQTITGKQFDLIGFDPRSMSHHSSAFNSIHLSLIHDIVS